MPNDRTNIPSNADAVAAVVGRLRLTQREVRLLLRGGRDRTTVAPDPADSGSRAGMVAGILADAMTLVGDDALMADWLRAPLPRRGGASPIEEATWVEGETALRFVLRPHPTELVWLIAQGSIASPTPLVAAARRTSGGNLAEMLP